MIRFLLFHMLTYKCLLQKRLLPPSFLLASLMFLLKIFRSFIVNLALQIIFDHGYSFSNHHQIFEFCML